MSIDELGNIHNAADELGMTQPAASKLLKELEAALDLSLFDRLPRASRRSAWSSVLTAWCASP